MNIESLISAHVRDLEAYEPPDWEAIAARAGRSPAQLVRLDTNENPYGPSPRVAEALAHFRGFEYYPDYRALTAAVAHYAGVEPGQIVLGNGGDEIIDLVVRLFVEPGQGAIICPPAFGMYTVSVEAHRGQVLGVPRRDDLTLDVDGIESLLAGDGTHIQPKLLFLTTPGNPDGQPISWDLVLHLLGLPLAVLVDEAYIEFGGESVIPLLDQHPNLIVLRTFSKWAGMAGLRLGYAVASAQVIRAMARLRLPYNVNAAAVVAAMAAFEDMAYAKDSIARIVAERQRLYVALAGMTGVEPLPSQANFVLCRLEARSGQEVADSLARQGILVRSFSDPSLADAVRITVGRPDQNDTLLAALAEILQVPSPISQSRLLDSQSPARRASIHRRTNETEVAVTINLDGTGHCEAETGLGFLDHMLAQIATHGLFDLEIWARGDLEVDEHHTVEDVAIGLGQAVDAALEKREGLVRMGHAYAPLDEALARVVVDLSGRPYAVIEAEFATPRVGAVSTDLITHFLETLAIHARLSLHARLLYGRNDHHRAEALFKALGRALDAASRRDPRRQGVPSTKGVL
jgi:histidinol-phosphate aminotransferase